MPTPRSVNAFRQNNISLCHVFTNYFKTSKAWKGWFLNPQFIDIFGPFKRQLVKYHTVRRMFA